MKLILSILISVIAFKVHGTAIFYRPQPPQNTNNYNLFVSSSGSDTNSGTFSAPFLTLAKAQTQARALNAIIPSNINITVTGTLSITNTLSLTSADNGANGYRVKWNGSLDACVTVTNWTPYKTNGNGLVTYQARYAGPSMRSVYVNGTRYFASQSPNDMGMVPTSTGFSGATGTFFATEPNITNVEYYGKIYGFSDSRNVPIGISGNNLSMLLPAHLLIYGVLRPTNVLFMNLFGWFTNNATAGTFYYDQSHTNILLNTNGPVNFATAQIVVPNGLTTAVSMTNCANIDISLSVQHTAWDIHPSGFASISWGNYLNPTMTTNDFLANQFFGSESVPPAIYLTHCQSCTVSNATIAHTDGNGIQVTTSSTDCSVTRNTVSDLAYVGIYLGYWTDGTNSLVSSNLLASQNYVYSVGQLAQGAAGIYFPFMTSSTISWNTVSNCPFGGISGGYGLDEHISWQAHTTRNSVNSNAVYNSMKIGRDGGAIYNQAPMDESKFTGNFISVTATNVPLVPDASGMYFDQGSRGESISNNAYVTTSGTAFNLILSSVIFTGNYSDNTNVYLGASIPSTYQLPITITNLSQVDSIRTNAGVRP